MMKWWPGPLGQSLYVSELTETHRIVVRWRVETFSPYRNPGHGWMPRHYLQKRRTSIWRRLWPWKTIKEIGVCTTIDEAIAFGRKKIQQKGKM